MASELALDELEEKVIITVEEEEEAGREGRGGGFLKAFEAAMTLALNTETRPAEDAAEAAATTLSEMCETEDNKKENLAEAGREKKESVEREAAEDEEEEEEKGKNAEEEEDEEEEEEVAVTAKLEGLTPEDDDEVDEAAGGGVGRCTTVFKKSKTLFAFRDVMSG